MKNATKTAIFALTGAGLLAVSAAAFAAQPGERMWDRLDPDGDGVVAVSEIEAKAAKRAAERAASMDANGDGVITREEAVAHATAKRAARKARREARWFPDANDDGVVSQAEFLEAAGARFEKLDKNGDGVLSKDEAPNRKHRKHRERR